MRCERCRTREATQLIVGILEGRATFVCDQCRLECHHPAYRYPGGFE